MSARGSFLLRLLGVVILVGVMLAGGALLFRAGQAQGYQMGVAANAAASGGGPGTAPITPSGPAYWPAYWPHYPGPHFGFTPFFPFGWLCGSIFFVFVALFALRLITRPWGWHQHGKGPGWCGPHTWGEHPHEWGPPPWMRDQPQSDTSPGGTKTTPDQPASGSPV